LGPKQEGRGGLGAVAGSGSDILFLGFHIRWEGVKVVAKVESLGERSQLDASTFTQQQITNNQQSSKRRRSTSRLHLLRLKGDTRISSYFPWITNVKLCSVLGLARRVSPLCVLSLKLPSNARTRNPRCPAWLYFWSPFVIRDFVGPLGSSCSWLVDV